MVNTKENKSTKKFDLANFNKEFVFKKEKTQSQSKIKSEEKIKKLNKEANIIVKPLYKLSVSEIMFGVKNTWFDILDDILAQKFDNQLFVKNNRLFYIGLTIIIIVVILYIYNIFVEEE